MIKSAIGNSGRVRALFTSAALAAAFIAAGCGDNGVAPIDAPPVVDAPPDAPLPPAQLALSPLTRDYGSVTVGLTSPSMSFTVTNTGGSPSGSISAAVMGSGSANFSIETNGCTTLAANATCTVAVSFSPTTPGPKTANLVVSGSPGGSVSASIDGTGVALGDLGINPSSNAFGNVVVGATSTTPATFTITNTGGTPTGTLNVVATGSDPGSFTKQSDTCNGQVLAGNATCTITVSFTPNSAGAKSASFTISGNPGGSVSAAVSGTGLAQAALAINPSLQDFGTTVTGAQSGTQTFTVTNTGGVASGAIANVLAGTDATQFTIVSGNCAGVMLNPNATCNIIVRFNPTSIGGKAAQLNVTGAPGGTASATLLGTGINPGAISITPSPFTYPQTTVGASSVSQVFTVSNNGGAATGALVTALGGNDPAHFTIVNGSNGCQGVVLQPAGSCTIAIQFTPTTAGSKSANITVSGTPGGTAVAGLNGDAVAGALLTMLPASFDYGSVGTGTQTAFQTFTVRNTGGQTSGVPAVALSGPQAGQFNLVSACTAALAPNATCTVQVRFAPSINGNAAASLNVSATPGGTVSSTLFGQGVNPAGLTVSPGALVFDNGNGPNDEVLLGESSIRTYVITNAVNAAPTGTITFAMSGTNAADYSFTHNCTFLPGGMSCTVTVTFTPSARGTRTASLTASATPGGNVSVSLTGESLPRLELIDPSTNPFVFDPAVINTLAPQQVTVTIRNNTRTTQTLTQATSPVFGPNAPFDIVSNGCGATLDSDDTCDVEVVFEPDAVGNNQTGTMTFSIPGVAGSAVQTLTGNGVDSLTIAPATTNDFMANATGTASSSLTFVVTNPSGSPTTGAIGTSMSNNSYQIVQDNCAGVELDGGDTCTIVVRFLPTVVGADQAGTLTVTATPGGTTSQALTGDGVNPAALTFNPTTTLAFGNVFSGSASTLSVTVSNPAGSAISGPVQFSLSGTNAGLFTLQPGLAQAGDCVTNSTTLAGGTNCTIRVQFAPTGTAFGDKTASLAISASPGQLPAQNINLTGTSVSALSVSPTNFDFGPRNLGTTTSQAFTVTNNSSLPVTITSTTPPVGPELAILSNTCTGTIAAGAPCTVTVRYAPATAGVDSASSFTVNSANGLATATVSGQANTDADVSFTETFPTTARFDFGSTLAGELGGSRTFTLRNNGEATAAPITAIVVSDVMSYTVTSTNCVGMALVANATCTVTLQFTPTPANATTADMLASLSAMGPVGTTNPTINVVGRRMASGALTFDPTVVAFSPALVVGSTSTPQLITVQNTSASPRTFNMVITVSSTNFAISPNFSITGNACGGTLTAGVLVGATLAAGTSCMVPVVFNPSAPGSLTGTLVINGVAGEPYAALSGTGLAPAMINVSPTSPAFPNTAVGTSSTSTVTLTNNGGVTSGAIVRSAVTGNDQTMFSTAGCPTALAAGTSCDITVTFTPANVGAKTASFTVQASPGVAPTTINLNATGVTNATLGISPSTQQNAGSRAIGDDDATGTVFAITNGGAVPSGDLAVTLSDTTGSYSVDQTGVANACVVGSPVAAGATCNVRVMFNPTVLGTVTTNVTVSANPGASVGSSITGVGTSALTASPATFDFGLTGAGNTSATTTITYTNTADVATGLLYTSLGGANPTQFSIVSDTCTGQTLTAAEAGTDDQCAIVVRFTPSSGAGTGDRSATLTVAGTPGNSATSTLSGTAN